MNQREPSMRRYLDLLTDAMMVRQLQPFHANIAKRQVKAPKIYLRDSGLYHHFLGIPDEQTLMRHPKIGASWEGHILEELLAHEPHDECFFWATHQGAEMDLVLRRGGDLLGIEIKRTDAPGMTASIRNALQDLGLRKVIIVYPGEKAYPLHENVWVIPSHHLTRTGSLFEQTETP